MNGAAFAEEFRITDHVELRFAAIVALDRFSHTLAGFHRDGALIDNHAIVGQNIGDLAGDFFDKAKIEMSILRLRPDYCPSLPGSKLRSKPNFGKAFNVKVNSTPYSFTPALSRITAPNEATQFVRSR